MTETRRLAAILAADVVGYSRLMGEDEAECEPSQHGGADRGWPLLNEIDATSNVSIDLHQMARPFNWWLPRARLWFRSSNHVS